MKSAETSAFSRSVTNADSLQEQLQAEIRDASLFERAEAFGLGYLSSAFDRNVFPTDEALRGLDQFDEDLPDGRGDAYEVLDQLNTYGGPATVTTIGG